MKKKVIIIIVLILCIICLFCTVSLGLTVYKVFFTNDYLYESTETTIDPQKVYALIDKKKDECGLQDYSYKVNRMPKIAAMGLRDPAPLFPVEIEWIKDNKVIEKGMIQFIYPGQTKVNHDYSIYGVTYVNEKGEHQFVNCPVTHNNPSK